MVVEPAQKDLIWSQSKEVVNCLPLFAKSIQFGMKLDVDLSKQATPNDLPNESQDKMLSALGKIGGSNVNHGAANTLGRGNNDVVVLGNLEGIEWLARLWLVEDSRIDRIRH